ncbi:hypothetical protein ACIA31_05055 [Lactobacillus delbrueckii subsp. bulgaricus]
MTELISIRESSKHVDEEVRMHVWLTDKRSSGKIDLDHNVNQPVSSAHSSTFLIAPVKG